MKSVVLADTLTVSIDQEGNTIKTGEADFNFSKEAADKVIQGVPRTDDCVE